MNPDKMTGPELIKAYNKIAAKHGVFQPKKFRDLATGRRRLAELLQDFPQTKPKPKPKPNPSRKRGRSEIAMPVGQKPNSPRKGSLKARALEKLKRGSTVKELTKMFEKSFADRGKSPKVSAKVRAREVILLLHVENDFGFYEKDGKVWAITEPKQ